MEKETVEASYWLLFFGVFFSETIKNVAKGSANALQNNVSSLLQSEIIALNLNATDSDEEYQKKLEAKPEIKAEIQRKLESYPDLLNEVVSALQLIDSEIIINAKNIGQVINNPTAPITQTNTFN